MLAHEAGDRELELWALLTLGQAQQQTGHGAQGQGPPPRPIACAKDPHRRRDQPRRCYPLPAPQRMNRRDAEQHEKAAQEPATNRRCGNAPTISHLSPTPRPAEEQHDHHQDDWKRHSAQNQITNHSRCHYSASPAAHTNQEHVVSLPRPFEADHQQNVVPKAVEHVIHAEVAALDLKRRGDAAAVPASRILRGSGPLQVHGD